jgi:hypothetical protein
MTIKDQRLITVKTISKAMAKQIQFVPYTPAKEGSLYMAITFHLADGAVRPIGWVPGAALGSSDEVSFWLVQHEGRYWWYMCPNGGALADKYPNVEQLFI